MQLAHPRKQVAARTGLGVIRRPLVGVLAVDEVGHLLEAPDQSLRKRVAVGEPTCDRGFVGCGYREGLGRERAPRVERDLLGLAELRQDRPVALRVAHRRDVGEILRCGTEHRRPADVDHLDRVLLLHAVPGDDLRERIEGDDDEVERADVVLVERREVVRMVAPREDRGVDARVQRLHAPAEELRDLRQVLDPRHLEAVLGQVVGRPAAGDDVDAELGEAAGELGQPGLVECGDEGAFDQEISSRTAFGSSRCSTSWTRARSVSTVSSSRTGTGSATITEPVSTPSST